MSTEISRAERIFRGMLGMGLTFAVVGGATLVVFLTLVLIFYPEPVNEAGGNFLGLAFFGGIAIAFGMGVLCAGLLALLARGRSFKQVSVAHMALSGAGAALVPILVASLVALGEGQLAKFLANVLTPFAIFASVSAALSTGTLLIARRAKPELGAGGAVEQARIQRT